MANFEYHLAKTESDMANIKSAYKKRKHKVQKLLRVGDVVYSAMNGKEMTVLSMNDMGFETEEDFFAYDEVTELYFLTKRGAMERR